jgi:hypothetical protein
MAAMKLIQTSPPEIEMRIENGPNNANFGGDMQESGHFSEILGQSGQQ